MGLIESIEEDEKKLKEIQEKEASEKQTEEKPVEEKVPDKEIAEDEKEKGDEEGEKVEVKPEEKEPHPAKLRADLKAAQKREAVLKEQLAKKPAEPKVEAKPEAKNQDPEPDKEDTEAHLAWELRQANKRIDELNGKISEKDPEVEAIKSRDRLNQAEQEFSFFESEFAKSVPDYKDVSSHMARTIYASIKVLNPSLSDQQAADAAKRQILSMAAKYLNAGYENPIEPLYHLAKEQYGFQPKAEEKQEEEESGPDLEKISKNKKRSASPLNGGGKNAAGAITAQAADKMTLGEFAALPPSTRKQLAGGRA